MSGVHSDPMKFCQGFIPLCDTDSDSLHCHLLFFLVWLRWDQKQHIHPICSMILSHNQAFPGLLSLCALCVRGCLFCENGFASFGGTCRVYSCTGCV